MAIRLRPACAAAHGCRECRWQRQPSRPGDRVPCGRPEDSPAISQLPPVPVNELLAAEKCQQAHAAEEDSERHLVTPQCDQRRGPCILSSGSTGFVKSAFSTLRALHPYG